MGVRPADDEHAQAFEADGEAKRFLESERLKVLLVQGAGGSGKSLFCHIFAKELLDEGKTEWTPIHINLPSLKDPITQVIDEHLKANRFDEKEIMKMQQSKLLLFLDGYDEIKKY